MKVIFRSNNHFAKKSLRNNAEVWVESLDKYLSEDAILRLSLFVNQDNIAKASLNIVDKDLHVYASHEDVSFSVALDSVVEKCAKQIVKKQSSEKSFRETIRYNDEYNVSFEGLNEDIELSPSTQDAFDLLETETSLANMKKTSRYNRAMNRYISYLYRKNDIERAECQLSVLYSIYENVDFETISVADYKRLSQSILQLEKEINSMIEKRRNFEKCAKDQHYINNVIEQEAKLAKLKSIK